MSINFLLKYSHYLQIFNQGVSSQEMNKHIAFKELHND